MFGVCGGTLLAGHLIPTGYAGVDTGFLRQNGKWNSAFQRQAPVFPPALKDRDSQRAAALSAVNRTSARWEQGKRAQTSRDRWRSRQRPQSARRSHGRSVFQEKGVGYDSGGQIFGRAQGEVGGLLLEDRPRARHTDPYERRVAHWGRMGARSVASKAFVGSRKDRSKSRSTPSSARKTSSMGMSAPPKGWTRGGGAFGEEHLGRNAEPSQPTTKSGLGQIWRYAVRRKRVSDRDGSASHSAARRRSARLILRPAHVLGCPASVRKLCTGERLDDLSVQLGAPAGCAQAIALGLKQRPLNSYAAFGPAKLAHRKSGVHGRSSRSFGEIPICIRRFWKGR